MKIFYAVQATGNGHISRAKQLMPHLSKYGDVDIFLSGSNSTLATGLPIRYRSPGVSLFYKSTGGLSYWDIATKNQYWKSLRDIRSLPVEKYDIILNDFDYVTSRACRLKNIPSVQFGHQASFASELTPRPHIKNYFGEWILRCYARASAYVGLHFKSYDSFIKPPIIKKACIDCEPKDFGHITVYLPSYNKNLLAPYFHTMRDVEFHLFSADVNHVHRDKNIIYHPISNSLFTESLIHCHGIITGGGFETPAEALYLKKKLIAIPISDHYEQKCNGAALKQLGATVWDDICFDTLSTQIYTWLDSTRPEIDIKANNISETLEYLFDNYPKHINCGIAS